MTTPLPPNAIEHMSFLAGHWRGQRGGAIIEEVWLAPSGGVSQGMVRLVKDGEIGTIELIIVAAEADRVVMRYNHFYTTGLPWETDGPIELVLTKANADEVVFSSPLDRPRHASEMGYRRSGDTLSSWVITVDASGALTQHDFELVRAP